MTLGNDATLTPFVTPSDAVRRMHANDPVSIRAARIRQDLLELDVTYAGGCEEHEFAVYWENMFAESAPPQARLVLLHDDKDDPCEAAAIPRTLSIDLTPVRHRYRVVYRSERGTVILNVVAGTQSSNATYSF